MTAFWKKYFALRQRNARIAWDRAKHMKFCYAFLAPSITEAILTGEQPPTLTLAQIPKTLPLTWSGQSQALGF